MKTSLRDSFCLQGLTLTALLLAPTAAFGQSSIGDLEGYQSSVATASTSNASDNDGVAATKEAYAPIDYADLHATEDLSSAGVKSVGHISDSCGCTSTTSCGSPSCDGASRTKLRKRLRRDDCNDPWLRAELLLWFPQARSAPALITSAPNTLAPTIGPTFPNTVVEFGGEDGLASGELSPGFRIDAGRYLNENVGIGGRFWFLGENSESYSASDTGAAGAPSLGRPFFNTNLGTNDSILVFAEEPGGDLFAGSIDAESSLDVIAAEAYGRLMFACGDEYRTDLIGGYSYFGIDDMLSINSTTVQTNPATGQTTIFSDLFDAENTFHGGQIGFETVLSRGKWLFTTLTKVHLGNMDSTLTVSGSSTTGVPPALTTVAGGALALDNIGTYERSEFTFVPEANVKVGYRFRDHVLFTVGYSFIYWDSVALAGDNITPIFDGTTVGTAGPFGQPPLGSIADSSLYVQGIDLGLVIDF